VAEAGVKDEQRTSKGRGKDEKTDNLIPYTTSALASASSNQEKAWVLRIKVCAVEGI